VTYRISGDISASSLIIRVAGADIAVDIQDGVGTTGTEDGAEEVELVTICVVGS
jgi:hypothetical protein